MLCFAWALKWFKGLESLLHNAKLLFTFYHTNNNYKGSLKESDEDGKTKKKKFIEISKKTFAWKT